MSARVGRRRLVRTPPPPTRAMPGDEFLEEGDEFARFRRSTPHEPELLTAAEAAQTRRARSRETGIFSGQLGSDELIENIQEAGGGGTDLAEALAGSTRNVDHLFGGGLIAHPRLSPSLAPGGDMVTGLAGAKARHEDLIDLLRSRGGEWPDAERKKLLEAIRQAAREHADLRLVSIKKSKLPPSAGKTLGESAADIAYGAGAAIRPVVSGAGAAKTLLGKLGGNLAHYSAKGATAVPRAAYRVGKATAGNIYRGATGGPKLSQLEAQAARELAREKKLAEKIRKAREASGE